MAVRKAVSPTIDTTERNRPKPSSATLTLTLTLTFTTRALVPVVSLVFPLLSCHFSPLFLPPIRIASLGTTQQVLDSVAPCQRLATFCGTGELPPTWSHPEMAHPPPSWTIPKRTLTTKAKTVLVVTTMAWTTVRPQRG